MKFQKREIFFPFREILECRPIQVGVQVPQAAETVARIAKLWGDGCVPGHALLQIDMRNALNSLDRVEMLKQVQRHAPALYPYAAACYG